MFVPLTVQDFLSHAETVYPKRIGIVDEPDQPAESWGNVTYAEMARRARAQAAGLDRLGVGVGQRVAIVSHNSARLLTSFFGVAGSGRILVPINFRLSEPEISYIVEHSGASVLMIDPELKDTLKSVKCKHRFTLGSEADSELLAYDRQPAEWKADEDATATINYTSGTTARPKGVQLTHRSCWINATLMGWHTGVSDNDVYLHTLPMFHANDWGMHFATVGMGAKQVMLRKIDGAEILRRVEKHGVTLACCAPAVVNSVLDAASSWKGEIPGKGTVRIVVAGAPPPSKTIERVETELGWQFNQIYGLTETSPLVTVNRNRSDWDAKTPGDRAKLLMRAGAPTIGTTLDVDHEGEVLVRSNTVMEGYWQQPEETAKALAGEWFHTGDGGFIDEQNYLNISDRRKDVIVSGGENVSSIEVEDAIFSHPDVEEVAVIGIPDEKWGELVAALVVKGPKADLSPDDVIAYCRKSLAGYKCPKKVEFRDELPRTATGKLQKFKLRQPFWEGRDRQVN